MPTGEVGMVNTRAHGLSAVNTGVAAAARNPTVSRKN